MTRPCATGCRGRGCRSRPARSCASPTAWTSWGSVYFQAGFPSSNPKELELFGLLAADSFGHAQICAFGMTRRRGVAADADPALRVIADCFAPVCTLVGKTWALHPAKVVKVG